MKLAKDIRRMCSGLNAQDKKGIFICIFEFLIVVLIQLIIAFVIKVSDFSVSLNALNYFYLILETGLSFIEMILLASVFRDSLKKSLCDYARSFSYNIIASILMLCIYVLTVSILSVCFLNDAAVANQDTVKNMNSINIWLNGINTIIFAPFIEEIFFRGLIFQFFRKKNVIMAFILTNIFFALAHTWIQIISKGITASLNATVLYMIIGMEITVFYMWRKNIWSSIVLHIIINAFSFIIINIPM